MTQTIETTTTSKVAPNGWDSTACPKWCTNGTDGYPCRGEHQAISAGSYILATGGHFGRTEAADGGKVPTIGVGLYWAEHWGEGQELFLAIDEDTSINLKPSEALALATEITTMLQAMVSASAININQAERVLELQSMAQSLASLLANGAPR